MSCDSLEHCNIVTYLRQKMDFKHFKRCVNYSQSRLAKKRRTRDDIKLKEIAIRLFHIRASLGTCRTGEGSKKDRKKIAVHAGVLEV